MSGDITTKKQSSQKKVNPAFVNIRHLFTSLARPRAFS